MGISRVRKKYDDNEERLISNSDLISKLKESDPMFKRYPLNDNLSVMKVGITSKASKITDILFQTIEIC